MPKATRNNSSDVAAAPTPVFRQRWAVGVAMAVVVLGILLAYGKDAWIVLVSGLVIESLFTCFWLTCATLAGWFVLDRVGVTVGRSLRLASAAGLGLGIVGLLTLGLGLLGLLNHWTASGMLVAVALPQALRILRQSTGFDMAGWLTAPTRYGFIWLVVAPFLAIALTAAMLPPGLLWKSAGDPHPFDVLEYHLQIPREWYEAGRIVALKHNAFSYFPAGAEIHYLLAMHLRGGPWEGMYLAQLMSVGFAAVAVLAVYETARALRPDDSPLVSMLAAAVAAVVPWTVLLSPVAYVESAMLCYATLAIGWVLVEPSTRRALIGGVFAGLACGVKYTAVPMVLLAVPVAMVVTGRKRALMPALVFVVAGVAMFSPWLVRNAAWTGGNPVFPEMARVLGAAHFTPEQVERWEQAHSPRQEQRPLGARLSAAGNQILLDWRYGFVLIPAAAIAAALTFRRRETAMLIVNLVAIAAIWLFATHLQSRFLVLAVPICALLLATSRWVVPALALALVAVPSYIHLDMALRPSLGLFGLTDFKDALPPAYGKLVDEGRSIALVGQSQAFWYQLPMSRLSYRTVFDVGASGSAVAINAWLGPEGRGDRWLLVYPSEMERFAKTYAHIPAPPAELIGQPEPVVIPPGRQ